MNSKLVKTVVTVMPMEHVFILGVTHRVVVMYVLYNNINEDKSICSLSSVFVDVQPLRGINQKGRN